MPVHDTRNRMRHNIYSYLFYRLGFILRHPHELGGLLHRAFALYQSQGWKGVQRGLCRDLKLMSDETPVDNTSRDYHQWLLANPPHVVPIAHEAKILFTVLLNTSEAREDSIVATIASLMNQSYSGWELFVATPPSRSHGLWSRHKRLISPQIHYLDCSAGKSAGALFNTILDKALGEYLIPLDCVGVLDRQALACFARQLSANRQAVHCYCDHDRLEGDGRRSNPYFKPDWNQLLLLTQDYVSPLAVFSKNLVKTIGGFSPLPNSKLIWDLSLKVSASVKPDQIIHCPQILFHEWEGRLLLSRDFCRSVKGLEECRERGALAPCHQSSALQKGDGDMREIVESYLPRLGFAGVRSIKTEEGMLRLSFPLTDSLPKVSVIIPTRNSLKILQRCIDSIFQKTNYPNFEIIIIDNQSDEPALGRYLDSLIVRSEVRVFKYDAPFNYSAINNFAVQHCHGEVLCFLNNDIEVISQDWLKELAALAMWPSHGAVGAMLYYPDDTIQHAGIILGYSVSGPGGVAANAFRGLPRGFSGQGGRLQHLQYISAVTGACLAVRRKVFEEVGGFDQENLAVAFNDVDFCLRLRNKGYRSVIAPFAELYHHESFSRGGDTTDAKQARFSREILTMRQRWGEILLHDPYFPSGELGMCKWQ